MAKLVITPAELKAALEEAGDKLVIIDFFAAWCPPCKVMSPVLDQVAETDPGVVALKVDIQRSDDLAEEYGISALPTFVFIKQRKNLGSFVGGDAPKFIEKLESLKTGG